MQYQDTTVTISAIAEKFRNMPVEDLSQDYLNQLREQRTSGMSNVDRTPIDEVQLSIYGVILNSGNPKLLGKAIEDATLKLSALGESRNAACHTVVFMSRKAPNPVQEIARLRQVVEQMEADIEHGRAVLHSRDSQIVVLQKRLDEIPAVRLNDDLVKLNIDLLTRISELEAMIGGIDQLRQEVDIAKRAFSELVDQAGESEEKAAVDIGRLTGELTEERMGRLADIATHASVVARLSEQLEKEKNTPVIMPDLSAEFHRKALLLEKISNLEEELRLERDTKPTSELESKVEAMEAAAKGDQAVIQGLAADNHELHGRVVDLKKRLETSNPVLDSKPCSDCAEHAGAIAKLQFANTELEKMVVESKNWRKDAEALEAYKADLKPTVLQVSKWLLAVKAAMDPDSPYLGTLEGCSAKLADLIPS